MAASDSRIAKAWVCSAVGGRGQTAGRLVLDAGILQAHGDKKAPRGASRGLAFESHGPQIRHGPLFCVYIVFSKIRLFLLKYPILPGSPRILLFNHLQIPTYFFKMRKLCFRALKPIASFTGEMIFRPRSHSSERGKC